MKIGKNDFYSKQKGNILQSNLPITGGGRWELKNKHNYYDL